MTTEYEADEKSHDLPEQVKFELPKQLLSSTGSAWGPPPGGDKNLAIFDRVFQPFSVRDPVDVVANWYLYSNDRVARQVEAGVQNNTEDVGPSVQQLEREFAIVSNIVKPTAQWQKMKNARIHNRKQREIQRERRKLRASTNNVKGSRTFGANTQRKRSKWHRNRKATSKYRQKQWQNRQIMQEGAHDTSVKVNHDTWRQVKEWEYIDLAKHKSDVPVTDPIVQTGILYPFNRKFEKITTNSKVFLKKFPKTRFFNVSAGDDPIFQKHMGNNTADVYITDTLVAVLMTVSRSAYSWDIVVTKSTIGDRSQLVFHQRPNSQIELLSVDETHAEQTVVPTNEEMTRRGEPDINSRHNLAVETTILNQRFQLMSLVLSKPKDAVRFPQPNPFASSCQGTDERPAPVAYHYRVYNMPVPKASGEKRDVLKVMVRNQYDAQIGGRPIQVHTFNQYDPRAQRAKNWAKDLDRSKGSIVMDEQRNNAAKVARWCACALISDVPQVKISFVARSEVKDNKKHKVLGMTSYTPQAFARELRLDPKAMWGSFGVICSTILKQEDGKFVLMKEPPPKKSLKLFRVPSHEFEDEYIQD